MAEQAGVEVAKDVTSEAENTQASSRLHPSMIERKWQPGQSGNPGGRPKRKPLTEELERLLDEIDPTDKKHRRTFRKRLAEALAFQVIKKGNVAAFTEIADRVEGKVVQRQEHTGADGGPVVFESIASRQEVEQRLVDILSRAEQRRGEPVTTPRVIEGETTSRPIAPVTIEQPQPVPTKPALDLSW